MIRELPEPFRRNVTGAFANGAAWLDSLPSLIAECEARWNIKVDAPYSLSFNYVAPAVTTGGQSVVAKLGVPNTGFVLEVHALQAYAGSGAVRLLDSDPDRGMMLLERLEPGHTLASLRDDDQATREAAEVMRDLRVALPSNSQFPSASQWAAGLSDLRNKFDGKTGPFSEGLVNQAESLFHELLSSQEPLVLLHGDLHHFNILSGQRRRWLAIDPKGLAGEPAYEVGALLRNPGPRLCMNPQVQRRRVEILHEELGFERDRILGWGMAQAVLSAWWSFEDSGAEWQWLCSCAELLARLLAESNR